MPLPIMLVVVDVEVEIDAHDEEKQQERCLSCLLLFFHTIFTYYLKGSEISQCLSLVLGVGSRASFSTSGLVKSPFKDDFQANGLFNDDF